MKSIVIAALFASTNAVKLEWPSVARCAPGQISTDSWPCDDNSKGPHHLDGTQVQLDSSDVVLFNMDGSKFVQTAEQWPSVARCPPGKISTDSDACDDNSKGPHHLDGTQVQIDGSDTVLFSLDGARIQTAVEWPSVARCPPGKISTDSDACDDNSKGPHHLDGTQLQLNYRPPIKCMDPTTGNPISCDWNDIDDTNSAPLAKKGGISGLTPVKEVPGGPTIDLFADKEKAKEAKTEE